MIHLGWASDGDVEALKLWLEVPPAPRAGDLSRSPAAGRPSFASRVPRCVPRLWPNVVTGRSSVDVPLRRR